MPYKKKPDWGTGVLIFVGVFVLAWLILGNGW